MYYFFKFSICIAVFLSFFCSSACAQDDLLDSNLHRYQSLPYYLKVEQDISALYTSPLNDKNVQAKIDDYFGSNNIACTRIQEAKHFPCLFVNVMQPGIVNSMGIGRPPNELCRVHFYVFDRVQGMYVVVWDFEEVASANVNLMDALASQYYQMIAKCLTYFGNAWEASHSRFGTKLTVYGKDEDKLKDFISSHINWSAFPAGIVKKSKQVRVKFSANEKGIIDSAKAINGIGDEYEKEVIRVIKSIPQWNVFYKNGVFQRNDGVLVINLDLVNKEIRVTSL